MKLGIFLFILFISTFCADSREKENIRLKISDKNIKQLSLSPSLNEISGIETDSTGRLFAHDDERGIIYELNTSNGSIVKKFQLGSFGIEADFEGMAIAGTRFFIIESTGMLYEFDEGADNEAVDITKYDLNFSSKFEIEGLCFDPGKNGLLIACKNYSGNKYKNERPVFIFSFESNKISTEPVFLIDLTTLKKKYDIKDFYPSGITVSPVDNNYYIISAKGEPALVILSGNGDIVSAERLKKKMHPQPEGITFLKDGTMVISDEKTNKSATLTLYIDENSNDNGF